MIRMDETDYCGCGEPLGYFERILCSKCRKKAARDNGDDVHHKRQYDKDIAHAAAVKRAKEQRENV